MGVLYKIFKNVKTNSIYNTRFERHYSGKIVGYRQSPYWEKDIDYKIKTLSGKEVFLNEHWVLPSNMIGRWIHSLFENPYDVFLEKWYELHIRK